MAWQNQIDNIGKKIYYIDKMTMAISILNYETRSYGV